MIMTKDEIIEMARQVGFVDYELDDGTTNAFDKRYEAFAKLVAEKEREACAKVCNEMQEKAEEYGTECCKWPTPSDCAYAIRERGVKHG
jgi:Skp family chaperone for outer membrane proteins